MMSHRRSLPKILEIFLDQWNIKKINESNIFYIISIKKLLNIIIQKIIV